MVISGRRTVLVLLTLLAIAGLTAADDVPPGRTAGHTWNVNLDGTSGLLHLVAAPGGRLEGTLLGAPVTGTLTGRRIVLLRGSGKGQEIWEGWVGTTVPPGADAAPMAGSATIPGRGLPVPWFATPQPADHRPPSPTPTAWERPPVTLPPSVTTSPESGVPATAPPPGPAPQEPAAASPAPLPPGGGPAVGGVWSTPDGPLEIIQDGRMLTFVLPDRRVSGRIIGPDTLIGGFGPGCCKGRLKDGGSIIVWDNGISWYREDGGRGH